MAIDKQFVCQIVNGEIQIKIYNDDIEDDLTFKGKEQVAKISTELDLFGKEDAVIVLTQGAKKSSMFLGQSKRIVVTLFPLVDGFGHSHPRNARVIDGTVLPSKDDREFIRFLKESHKNAVEVLQKNDARQIQPELQGHLLEQKKKVNEGELKQNEDNSLADNAMLIQEALGGIDLNPEKLNLFIEKEQGGVTFPAIDPEDLENANIPGLTPVIIEIIPVTNWTPLLGSFKEEEDQQEQQLSFSW